MFFCIPENSWKGVSLTGAMCQKCSGYFTFQKSDAFASGPVLPQKPKCVSEAQRSFMSNTMILLSKES